ncbi:MAG: arginine repressor [Clostridiales bacterium]|nr:arginine repressor [Clostridiales bacterium]
MKTDRQKKILEIVTDYDIETQEELQKQLLQSGFDVTQATVSRDIREMGLTKVSNSRGAYRYAAPNSVSASTDKYRKIITEAVIRAESANNLIIVKTYPGMAQAAGAAVDSLEMNGIIGSIAGDDTILIVSRSDEIAAEITRHIDAIVAEGQPRR